MEGAFERETEGEGFSAGEELGGLATQKAQQAVKGSSELLLGHINNQSFCPASAEVKQVDSQRALEAPPASGCRRFFFVFFWLAASADRSRGKQPAEAREAYTWPSSWAMVNAVLRPLSSMMLQLLYGSHTVPSSARPSPKKNEKKILHF